MKICKDCKHYKHTRGGEHQDELHECEKSKITETSYVTGHVTYKYMECWQMRRDSGLCGEDAKLFEPRETPEPKVWHGDNSILS